MSAVALRKYVAPRYVLHSQMQDRWTELKEIKIPVFQAWLDKIDSTILVGRVTKFKDAFDSLISKISQERKFIGIRETSIIDTNSFVLDFPTVFRPLLGPIKKEIDKTYTALKDEVIRELAKKISEEDLTIVKEEMEAIGIGKWLEIQKENPCSPIFLIEKLDLTCCGMYYFPKELLYLKNLKHLDLSHNNFSDIPDDFNALENLEHLRLNGNTLDHIPEVIFEMQSIRILDLSYNSIQRVPYGITKMKNLEFLDVSFNKVEFVSLFMASLRKLEVFNLDNN
jgi:Leucine-rich repeat (LRR) protein